MKKYKSFDMAELADHISEVYAAQMEVPKPEDVTTLEQQKEVILLMLPTVIPKLIERMTEFAIRPIMEGMTDAKGDANKFYELIECSPMWTMVVERIELGFDKYGNDAFKWDSNRLTDEMLEEVCDMLVYAAINMFVMYSSIKQQIDDGDLSYDDLEASYSKDGPDVWD